MRRQELVCRFKGHIWKASGPTPNPLQAGSGSYTVHRRCFRCGKYERLKRQAVLFFPKEN